jgi:hypothetical protein
VEVCIKGLGGFTKALIKLCDDASNDDGDGKLPLVRIDGPYGNTRAAAHRRFDALVMVAGGVGITPTISFLKDVYRVGDDYGDNAAAATPPPSHLKTVVLIWTVASPDCIVWFADVFAAVRARCAADTSLPRFVLSIHCSKVASDGVRGGDVDSGGFATTRVRIGGDDDDDNGGGDGGGGGKHSVAVTPGRADIAARFQAMCSDGGGNMFAKNHTAFVFACGPKTMVRECWRSVTGMRRRGDVARIDFEHAIFEW